MPNIAQNAERVTFGESQFARSGGKWQPSMIFKAGDYPDKGVVVTHADITRLAATSSAIPISIGHPSADSPIDGMMGVISDIHARGDELWGTPEPAKWLDDLLPDQVGISVWLTWSPQRLVDASIVSNPRVDGASLQRALTAAFSAGQEAPRKESPMEGNATNPFEKFFEVLFGSRQQGGAPPQAPQVPAPVFTPAPTPTPAAPADPQFAAMQTELAQYRQAAINARKAEVAQFSQTLIEKGRILPASKADVESLLLSAVEADQSSVQFSSKPEGGLFAQLRKVLDSLPGDPRGMLRSGFSVLPGQNPAPQDDVAAAFALARGEKK